MLSYRNTRHFHFTLNFKYSFSNNTCIMITLSWFSWFSIHDEKHSCVVLDGSPWFLMVSDGFLSFSMVMIIMVLYSSAWFSLFSLFSKVLHGIPWYSIVINGFYLCSMLMVFKGFISILLENVVIFLNYDGN